VEDIAERHQPAEGVPEEGERAARRNRAHGSDPLLEVVVELRPAIDRGAWAAGGAEPTLVVGVGVDAGLRELGADVLIATGMLGEAVHEQHRRPWLAAADRPMADQEGRAVARRNVIDPCFAAHHGSLRRAWGVDTIARDDLARGRRPRLHAEVPVLQPADRDRPRWAGRARRGYAVDASPGA